MVAVVSGSSLGLTNTSQKILGGSDGSVGHGPEQAYVNTATGNLVIQDRDEYLTGLGIHSPLVRTYNSQGLMNDDNGDNWRLIVHQSVGGLTGTLNTDGSKITKTFGDGAAIVYTYKSPPGLYVSTDGDGAHDTLSWNSSTSRWTWTDGSQRLTEVYDASGRLLTSSDTDGNTLTYHYTGSLLTSVTDNSTPVQTTYFDYTGNNLTAIRVESGGVTQTLTTYSYDASNRLTNVRVDLTPSNTSDSKVYQTTYAYEAASKRVASISYGDSTTVASTVSFTYQSIDGEYRVKTFTDGDGKVTTYNYSSATTTAGGTTGGGGGSGPQTVTANGSALSTTESQLQQVTVPPYAYVQTGDTWASLAARLYGDAGYAQALKTALGSPALTSGLKLSNLPTSLSASTLPAVPHVLGSPGGSDVSPVVNTYYDADGRIAGSLHADGSITSYTYDGAGNLVERRHHAVDPTFPIAYQDFTVDAAGVTGFPSGFVTQANGQLSVNVLPGPATGYFGLANFADGPVFRAEATTPSFPMTGAITLGVTSTDQHRVLSLKLDANGLNSIIYKDGTFTTIPAGFIEANTTYVIEFIASDAGMTVYAYKKGELRDGHSYRIPFTDWGDTKMFIDVAGDNTTPASVVGVDNLSVTKGFGKMVGPWFAPESSADTVNAFAFQDPEYTVQAGDTWASIATALYGYGTSDIADELAAALGNPTLTEDFELHDLPQILVDSDVAGTASRELNASASSTTEQQQVNVTVPAYYVVQSGDTWSSIASAVYGTSDSALVSTLQRVLGTPTLSAGLHLTMPQSLAYGDGASAADGSLLTKSQTTTSTTSGHLDSSALTPGTVPAATPVLLSDVPVTDISMSRNEWRFYRIDVPAGTSSLFVRTTGVVGDIDVRLRRGSLPTYFDYDYRGGDSADANELIDVSSPEEGAWYVALTAFEAASGATLVTSIQTGTDQTQVLTPSVPVNQLYGSPGSQRFFSFDVPVGTSNFRLALTGTNGDLDLYARHGSPPTTSTYDYASFLETSNEAVSLDNPQSGTWYVLIDGIHSTGDASLVLHTNLAGANTPPSVDAGVSKVVANASVVTLNGTASDAQGSVSYQWTQISGPSVALSNATTANASFTAPTLSSPTKLVFRLTVTDTSGVTNSDVVNIQVGPPLSDGQPSGWGPPALLETSGSPASGLVAGASQANIATTVWLQGNALRASTYNPVTHTWSVPVTVSGSSTTPVDFKLDVDMESGNALLVWRDSATGEIRANRLIVDVATGAFAWQGSELIGTVSGATVSELRGAINHNGQAAVIWTETSGSTKTLKTRRYSGSWASAETVASSTGTLDSARVAISNSDLLRVVWRANSGTDFAVMERGYYDNAWSSAIQVGSASAHVSNLRLNPDENATSVAWTDGGTIYWYYSSDDTWFGGEYVSTTSDITDFAMVQQSVLAVFTWTTADGRVEGTSTDSSGILLFAYGQALSDLRLHANNSSAVVVTWRDGENAYALNYEDYVAQGAQRIRSLGPASNAYAFVSRDFSAAERWQGVSIWLENDNVYSSFYNFAQELSSDPYYEVKAGDTWASIAQALYGSAAYASALQTALGNPSLVAGSRFTGLPRSLTATTTNTTAVPAYYAVPAGATWASITLALYGTSDAAAVAALQAATGSPTLTTGLHLTVPATLSYGSGSGGVGGTPTTITIYQQTDIVGPLGGTTTLVTDATGRLAGISRPTVGGARTETRYQYDDDGNLKKIIEDPNGANRTITRKYDSSGNLLFSWDAAGNTTAYTYSATNQVLTVTQYTVADPDGEGTSGQPSGAMTTRYAYGATDHLRFVVSAEGRVTEYRYNPNGTRAAAIVYTGDRYDLPAFNESDVSTWAASQPLTTTQRTDYLYDARGNLTTATSAGSTTHYVYDQRGQLLQTIDARGDTTTATDDYVTTYTYDGLGRVLTTTRWVADGVTSPTTVNLYDDANNAVQITYANGLVETRAFDDAGRLISVGYSNGATTTYAYDSEGRLLRVTDATGVSTYSVYDASGRKQFDVDANGSLTEYVYDGSNHVIKTIQYASAANTSLLVNGSNVPLENVDAAALRASASATGDRVSRAVYDASNRLVYTIDAEGEVTETRYDGASRVIEVIAYATRISISAAAGEISVATVAGLVAPIVSADDRHARSFYDADGRLLGSLDAAGYLVGYEYDDAGQLLRTIGYAAATTPANRASGSLGSLIPTADPLHDVVSHFFYDAQGRRVGSLDGEGYLTETIYTKNGNVAQTIRYDVRRTYTEGATLDSLRPSALGKSQVRSFTYDGFNRLKDETNAEGTVTHYEYDAVGNLIATTQAAATTESRTTQTRYDVMGRVTAELTAEGSARIAGGMDVNQAWAQFSVTHQYDLAGRRISTTDQNGNKTLFFYDVDGHLTHSVNALGEVVEQRYNALNQLTTTVAYTNRISTSGLVGGLVNSTLTGRIASIADASKDSTTSLTYTATGRVLTTSTAAGASVTYSYDAFGDRIGSVETIDATRSLEHTYKFDSRGLLLKTQWDPLGFNTSQENTYDAFGRVLTSTDANGKVTQFGYDRLGQVITTTDRTNAVRSTSYDAFGRVLTVTDATGQATSYEYDDASRSVIVTTPENISIKTVRNRHGQAATVTDGNRIATNGLAGNTTTYQYDENGQLKEISDSLGTLTVQDYDDAGRLLTITDGHGSVTTIAYDAANRVFTRTVDSNGAALVTRYAYDGQGRSFETTDARNVVTRTEYDQDGHVRAVVTDYGNAPHLNLRTEYEYDKRGLVTQVTEGVGGPNPRVTQYTYDKLGRRTSEVVDPGVGKLNLTTSYEYDGNGNVVRKIDPKLNSTRFLYDGEGRLAYTVDALGGVTGTTYDAEGRVVSTRRYSTTVTLANLPASGPTTVAQLGISALAADRLEQRVYDHDGRLVYTIDAMGGVTRRDYDANGNVVRQHIYSERVGTATYSSVDQVFNALGSVNDGKPENDRESRTVYDARNRAAFGIDGAGAVTRYTYDPAGNVIERTTFAKLRTDADVPDFATMTGWASTPANLDAAHDRTTRMWYDGANRLVYTLDAEGYVTHFGYDGVGNVTSQTLYATPLTSVPGPSVAEVDGAITHVALHDETTASIYDGGGRLKSVTDGENHTESYGYDEVGNRTSMTNKKGDTWTYLYDANHRLLEEHSPPGIKITTVQPADGVLNSDTQTATLVTKMTYDELGNVRTRTEAFGRDEARTTTYFYDALGRQTRVEFPPLNVYNASADDISRAGTAVVATEIEVFPFSETTYDVFGNAVMNRDVSGNYSHKVYDKLGRVIYEVDAERYLTAYGYDTFGNQISLTRFANRLNDGAIGGVSLTPSTLLSQAVIDARKALAPTADRTIETEYDRLNRVSKVTQPSAFYFESMNSSSPYSTAGGTTKFAYDAFGSVVKESKLLSSTDNFWTDKYSYYDKRGHVAATVDALGYVTSYKYDAAGNVTGHLEYARALTAGQWSATGYTLPTASIPQPGVAAPMLGYDRDVRYSYDRVNRKIEERLVNFAHASSANVTDVVIEDRVTTFEYDVLGNQTRVTDAAGNSTYTYYDKLGRTTAIAQPTRNLGNGTSFTPLIEMLRDAFGNVTVQIEHANGASTANASDFTAGAAATADRISLMQLDGYGHIVRSQDATGAARFASYNIRGDLEKEWQPVHDNANNVKTLVTFYRYDKLGHQVALIEPQDLTNPASLKYSMQVTRYNAFGEITGKGFANPTDNPSTWSFHETYEYDRAGHMWRTNAEDGVYRVYLYNLVGQVTAEIRSQVTNAIKALASADVAISLSNVIRTNTRYDLAGRAVDQQEQGFTTGSRIFVPGAVAALYAGFRVETLLVPNNPAAVYRQVFDANGDVQFVVAPNATLDQDGGFYFDGTNYVQDTNFRLVPTEYLDWSSTGAISDTRVFKYRLAGNPNGAWQTLSIDSLLNGRIGVRLDRVAAGDYEYVVEYTHEGETTPYTRATGTLSVSGTLRAEPTVHSDELDDSGVVAPIAVSVHTDAVPETIVTPLSVSGTITSTDKLNDVSSGLTFFSGQNSVVLNFPAFSGQGTVEIEYITDAAIFRDWFGPGQDKVFYQPESRTIALPIEDGAVGASGLTLTWRDPPGAAGPGGITSITQIRIYDRLGNLLMQSGPAPAASPPPPPDSKITLIWAAPRDPNVTATFEVRLKGTNASWQSLAIERKGRYFIVDPSALGNGTWEYRVTYTRDSVVTAAAEGNIDIVGGSYAHDVDVAQPAAGASPTAYPETVSPLQVWEGSDDDAEADLSGTTSARAQVSGGVEYVDGFSQQPTISWTGTNTVSFVEGFGGPLKVELDYTTADLPLYLNNGSRWVLSGTQAGVSQTHTFEFGSGASIDQLQWTDTTGNGGLKSVDGIRIYRPDGSGGWVLTWQSDYTEMPANRVVYWKAPQGVGVQPRIQVRKVGTTGAWQEIELLSFTSHGTRYWGIDVVAKGLNGTYDYRIAYQAVDPVTGGTRILSNAAGQFVATSGAPLEMLSQSNLLFDRDVGTVGQIFSSGTTISWSRTPQAGTAVTVRHRLVGETTWQLSTPNGTAPNFSFDLGAGSVEFEILYYRANIDAPYARSSGVLNPPPTEPPPQLAEPVAPIRGANVGPVTIVSTVGAVEVETGPPYLPFGHGFIDYYPVPHQWTGTNTIVLAWDDVGAANVRVELDYITSDRNSYNYTANWDPPGASPRQWDENPGLVRGIAASKTFNYSGNAATGATLTWNDAAAGQEGGIGSVQRVRVYVQDAQGNWILKYDRDAASPAPGRSLYWAPPVDHSLTQVFRYRLNGSNAWQQLTVGAANSYSFVSLNTLSPGNYEYELTYEINGVPKSIATGQFTLDAVMFGGTIHVDQNNIVLGEGGASLGPIVANGGTLSWLHSKISGDTITVRSRAAGTSNWTTQTLSGSGPSFSAVLSTGALVGAIDFEILYTHAGDTEPYLRTTGILNQQAAVKVTPASVHMTQQATVTTEPLPIEPVYPNGQLIQWWMSAVAGTTITFRYRQVGQSTWSTLTASGSAGVYSVDPGALPLGTYSYEITYVRSGETEPYALGSGTFDVHLARSGGRVDMRDTTVQEGTTVFIAPNPRQTIDRWGNAVTTLDAQDHAATVYLYDQLGQLTYVGQPGALIVNTTGGTVTSTVGFATSRNYYDILGRLVATQDANGNVTKVTYNAGGEIVSELHPDGGVKTYVYDAFGNRVLETKEHEALATNLILTRNTYDKANRLVMTEQELVSGALAANDAEHILENTYVYDEAGRRIREINGEHETTKYDYDLNDHLIARTTPEGRTTTYSYDVFDHKTGQTEANGDSTQSVYNLFGKLMSLDTETYQYDGAGQLTQRKRGNLGKMTYQYDEHGRVIRILEEQTSTDQVVTKVRETIYGYDLNGRRIHEKLTLDGTVFSDTELTYDSQNRLIRSVDGLYSVEYQYDAAGNRTHIHATYVNHAGGPNTQDLWYTYDAMNRVLVSQGVKTGDQIDIGMLQGTRLTYNVAGERTSAYTFGSFPMLTITYNEETGAQIPAYMSDTGFFTEQYGYDGAGRLITTDRSMTHNENGNVFESMERVNTRVYDHASREISDTTVTVERGGLASRERKTTYDADGRPIVQETLLGGLLESVVRYGNSTHEVGWSNGGSDPLDEGLYSYDYWTQGFDAAGVLRSYSVEVYEAGQYKYTTTHTFDYRYASGSWIQLAETAFSTGARGVTVPQYGSVVRRYDAFDRLVATVDSSDSKQNRYFAYNADGQVVAAVQGSLEGQSGGVAAQALRNSLTQADNALKAQHFFFANGQQVGSFGQLTGDDGRFIANFDVNFTPVSPGYPETIPSQVVAQSGDTLRIIAARVFGDPNLWYLIAQENGLTDPDAQIAEGTALRIPNEVVSLSNSASSFKPFDVTSAIGDVSPTLLLPAPPPRKKKGCGVLGQIIVVIVAIVVTWLSYGALSEYTYPWVAAAFGAAAGSAASQGVAIAIGQQESFSWKQVGVAAASAAIGSGIGAAIGTATVPAQIATAALSNAAGQGVSILLGVQKSFSWGALAASTVSAPFAASAGKAAGEFVGPGFAGNFASSLASGFVQQVGSVAFNGGRIDYANLAADAFGNALGNSIVSASSGAELSREQKRQMYGDVDAATRSSMAEFDDQLSTDLSLDLAMRQSNAEFNDRLQSDLAQYSDRLAFETGVGQRARINARDFNDSLTESIQRAAQLPQFTEEPMDAITAAEYAAREGRTVNFLKDQAAALSAASTAKRYGGGAATMRDNSAGVRDLGWRDAWNTFGAFTHGVADPLIDTVKGVGRIFTDFDNSVLGRAGLQVSDELSAWRDGGFSNTNTYGAFADRGAYYLQDPTRVLPAVDQAQTIYRLGSAGAEWWQSASIDERLDAGGKLAGTVATFWTPEASVGLVSLAAKGDALFSSLRVANRAESVLLKSTGVPNTGVPFLDALAVNSSSFEQKMDAIRRAGFDVVADPALEARGEFSVGRFAYNPDTMTRLDLAHELRHFKQLQQMTDNGIYLNDKAFRISQAPAELGAYRYEESLWTRTGAKPSAEYLEFHNAQLETFESGMLEFRSVAAKSYNSKWRGIRW